MPPGAVPGGAVAGAPVAIPLGGGADSGDQPNPAAIPGAPGVALGAGEDGVPVGPGGPGGNQAQNLGEKGSLEYAVRKLIAMAQTGDYSGAEEIISEKAKNNLAAAIRDAKLTASQIESFKAIFDKTDLISRKATGGGQQFSLRAGQNQIVQILVVKEGNYFRVKDVKIQDGNRK